MQLAEVGKRAGRIRSRSGTGQAAMLGAPRCGDNAGTPWGWPSLLRYPPETPWRVINAGPTSEMEVLADTFFAAIGSAQRELLAVTPYLVPTPDILRAFRVAALRGVAVRLVLPLKNNHVYAGTVGRTLYDDLLAAGVRILERPPPFIHAKALIMDDVLAIVGTANLDVRSLRLNYETNIAVFDEDFVRALKRIMLEDLDTSRELELGRWRARPGACRILENACNLLTPIL